MYCKCYLLQEILIILYNVILYLKGDGANDDKIVRSDDWYYILII